MFTIVIICNVICSYLERVKFHKELIAVKINKYFSPEALKDLHPIQKPLWNVWPPICSSAGKGWAYRTLAVSPRPSCPVWSQSATAVPSGKETARWGGRLWKPKLVVQVKPVMATPCLSMENLWGSGIVIWAQLQYYKGSLFFWTFCQILLISLFRFLFSYDMSLA